jgi:hypothetical protein
MGYLLLAIIAMTGLLMSIACHLMGWLQMDPPWGKSVFILHIGIFVVWLPLVMLANRTMPKGAERNNMKHLLAELPGWVRVACSVLFAYAMLHFVYFIYCAKQFPKNGVPFISNCEDFQGTG